MTNEQKQCLLRYLGYYADDIDGIFGRNSVHATAGFQDDYGLDPDGVFGPETEKMILAAVAGTARPVEQVDFWGGIKYWTREEFRCQCGGQYCDGFPTEPDKILVCLADNVREYFGMPGIRSSGLRCKEWNRIQGGVENSRHIYGKALDFRIEGKTSDEILSYVKTLPEVRYAYAIDGTYVHMDVE